MGDIRFENSNIKFEVRTCGILKDKDKILVSYENDETNTITLNGGAVKVGETTEQALMREFRVETNLIIKVNKLVGIVENFFTINNQAHHEILFVYKISLKNNVNQVLKCKENPDSKWDSIKNINYLKPIILNEIIHMNNDSLVHYINDENKEI